MTRVAAGHYENFPVASMLVPRRLRGAVLAIYRFARSADDIADEGDGSALERLARLGQYAEALDRIDAGETPPMAPFPELAAAVRCHALPTSPFRDLLSAFAQDVTVHRYPTMDALLDYCRRSANPVGRLLLHLYSAATPRNLAWSDSICTGLQLVNFWQDVAPDWQRGRIYLPEEHRQRFGVGESAIAGGNVDAAFRALMAYETADARSRLEAGRPLVRALPWRLGLELSGVLAGGHRILDAIDAVGGDIFRHRPRLSTADWIVVAARALFPSRRPPSSADHPR